MEQEEAMWKHIYEKMQKQQSLERTEREQSIQDLDNGFFERFGTILERQQTVLAEEETKDFVVAARSAFVDDSEEALKDENEEDDIKVALHDTNQSDSEPEDINTTDYLPVVWNIEELYVEILYEILHNVGCDVNCEIGQTALFSYIQDAFKMSNDKHTTLMEAAEQKEAPDILLNVEVIEAKELTAKDSNGLSDPFVTLYISSNTTHRFNSSVKEATLSPVWEEHFALPVSDKTVDDSLCMEVWDFDPAETVREKMSKIKTVKGVKGLRKLVKEIALTVTTGQHENELIGEANIPLKAIPASGMTMWYSLTKKNRSNRRGVLKVRLAFGSEKNSQVAAQEHRHLLHILLLHELELSKVIEYWWCGNFSPQAEALITQHCAQSGLSPLCVSFCQWAVYCAVHTDHPLSFDLFSNLLGKLKKPLETSGASEDDVRIFWDATKKLLPSCFSIIRKIRKKTSGDKNMMKQMVEVLKLLNTLMSLQVPENTKLFPTKMYQWLRKKGKDETWSIHEVLTEAVTQGATHWYNYILENNQCQETTDEGKLQYLLKIIQLVRTDLQKAVEYYDKIFQETVNLQYAGELYKIFEAKITALVEPEVTDICKNLKQLFYPGSSYKVNANIDPEEPLAMGTTLFELYLVMQRFHSLGQGLNPTEYENFQIKNFYSWFQSGVAQWLEIAVYKALKRIEKAIEVDNLVPVDDSVKYSSSAVDTIAIFYQVKTFWQQLNWPEVEGCYTFVAKIIDDICRCCVFFADHMSARVEGMGEVQDSYEKKFEVTCEWCLAINNIDYVRQSLPLFTQELGMDDIIQKISDIRSPVEADRCRQTLNNVIENAIDTVRNKIIELLETVAQKMCPAMKRLLVEGAEILHQDSNSIDRVMLYIDNNLKTLHDHLNDENFCRTLDIIWDNVSKILYDIIQSNMDKRRPPSFYANLHETLKLMVGCFKNGEHNTSECAELQKVEKLLTLNGMETLDLIHQVHVDRWREQPSIKNSVFGQLTVRLQFQGNMLHIEVMNARNLKAMDSNGTTDSFIRIHFLPEDKFMSLVKPKTKIHYKSLFPLYDETFLIELTPEQRNVKDGLILFSVKDKDFLTNQYIAEAYVHFAEIPETTTSLKSLPQVHLELHRPTLTDTDTLKALEHRQGDKLAKDFVKKFRQKIGAASK